MFFNEILEAGLICCPETGASPERLEPWLYGADTGALYPVICDTAVLHPSIERYLEANVWAIARAMAEMKERGEVRDWFFSRFDSFSSGTEAELDTGIQGEGYPGFWDEVPLPDFVVPLVANAPETLIMEMVGNKRFSMGLDLGCGQGGMTQHMAAQCDRVIGLDNNFFLCASANRSLRASEIPMRYFIPELGPHQTSLEKPAVNNALVICGDATALPFSGSSFDWVHCGHLLDLVDDPVEVIEQVLEVMTPDAVLTIATPWDIEDADHFHDMFALLSREFEELDKADGIPWLRFNHKRRFVLHEDWLWMGQRNA